MKDLLLSATLPLVAFLVQATIVAGVALAAGRFMPNRAVAHRIAVYRAAILAILALTLVGPTMRGAVRAIVELRPGQPPTASAVPELVLPKTAKHVPTPSAPIDKSTSIGRAVLPTNASSGEVPAGHLLDPLAPGKAFTLIYLAGVVFVSLGVLAGTAWLFRLRTGTSPFGKVPFTVTSPRVRSAFTAGALRPTIYLPANIEAKYSPEMIEAILRHEQIHIAQRDCLWTLVSRLACAVTWISPLTWILAKKMKEDSEQLCDQLVLESGIEPAGYAGCLLKIAESFVSSPAERYVGAGVVTAKSQLSKRISLMLKSKSQSSTPVSRLGRLKIASAFALTLCVATAVISAPPLVRARHDATPEATLTAFFASANKQDWEGAFSRIEGAKMDVLLPELHSLPRNANSSAAMVQAHFSNVMVNGDTATISVHLESMARGGQAMDDVATLHKVNGDWKIAGGKDPHGLLEQIAEASRDPAKLKKARQAAKKTMVISNFKQLAIAVLMYAADNLDKYSLSQAKLHSALKPYTRNDRLWLDADQKPMDVRINPWIIGKSDTQIPDPADCVLLSLGPRGHLQELYGMTPVAFCDGHVKFMTLQQATKLSWK